jgi:hypothetical protein
VHKFEIGFVWQTGRTKIETSMIGWLLSHFKTKIKLKFRKKKSKNKFSKGFDWTKNNV